MLRYTAPERGILVTIYLTNNRSVILAQREFCRRFPGRPTPTGETLRRLAARLEETGTTRDAARRGRPRSSRSAENIAAVARSVDEELALSILQRYLELGILYGRHWKILL